MKIDIVNVSGGVDSTACYLLALERREQTGQDFRAVFADTGNEHEITVDYIHDLAQKTGGPEVQTVKADFSQRLAVRRSGLEMMLESGEYPEGYTGEYAQRILKNLYSSGNPFLDSCLYYGYFPTHGARFCTSELKGVAIKRKSQEPAITEAIAAGGTPQDVTTWVGIRRDESASRANDEEWDRESNGSRIYRPLVEWEKHKCFSLLRRHAVAPNPLYKMGYSRVGCMPCILCRKAEIRETFKRFPAHISRIRTWERLVSACSLSGDKTFFIPAGIDGMCEWSMTGRGGSQFDMLAMMKPLSCSSLYGLCE